jgi:hypothetical protein
MKTVEFIRERSREKDFPLQVVAAGVLAACGGPLVVAPALGFVAIDAALSALAAAPRAVTGPLRWWEQVRRQQAAETDRRRRQAEAETAAERQRLEAEMIRNQSDVQAIDAQYEVVRFYEENRWLLEDAMPPSLFRSHMHTRFPPHVNGAEAWSTASAMIGEMLPLIGAGRERRRTEEAEQKKRDEETAAAAKLERDLENSRHAVGRLAQWYEREKAKTEELLPEGPLRDVALMTLYDRFDQLLKEALQDSKP